MKVALAQDNPKRRVEGQKRFHQSAFIPEEIGIKEEMLQWKCRHGKGNVMNVYDNVFT
jgi:hypothetical protein